MKRIRDLKEQIEMDKKSKQDVEHFYRSTLDEKEKLIVTLRAANQVQPLSPTKSEKEETIFNAENGQKGETVEELKDKITRLELLLKKSKEYIKSQKDQINSFNAENALKGNENEKLMKLEEERNKYEKEYKNAELKINELNSMVAESRENQTKLNALLNELNDRDVFYKEQIKLMNLDFEEKQLKFESEIKLLKENVEVLRQENENVTFSQFDESKNKIKELEALIDMLNSNERESTKKFSEKVSELEKAIESKEQLLADEKIKSLELIEKLKSDSEMNVKAEELNNANLLSLKSEVENLRHLQERLTVENNELEALNEDLKKTKQEMEEELRSLNSKVSILEIENDNLKTGLAQEIQKSDKSSEQIEKLKSYHEKNMIDVGEVNENLKNKIKSTEEALIQATSEIDKIKLNAEINLNEAMKQINEKYFDLKSIINEKFDNNDENLDFSVLFDNFKSKFENQLSEFEIEIKKLKEEKDAAASALNVEKDNYKLLYKEFDQFKETELLNLKNNYEIECENLNRKYEKMLIEHEVIIFLFSFECSLKVLIIF